MTQLKTHEDIELCEVYQEGVKNAIHDPFWHTLFGHGLLFKQIEKLEME